MERSDSVLDQFRTAEQRVADRLPNSSRSWRSTASSSRSPSASGLDCSDLAPASDKQRPASPASAQGRRRRSQPKAGSAGSTPEAEAKGETAKASAAGAPARAVRRSGSVGDKGPGLNSGSRQQEVLRLVNQHPGITVREIASELAVHATGLYRAVHKLEQQGAISKHGAALQPTGR